MSYFDAALAMPDLSSQKILVISFEPTWCEAYTGSQPRPKGRLIPLSELKIWLQK
ncbi:MAG: hypothetical protein Greene041662_367 [Candidatus Peregrinibacteria bacterium Greene0416_62]|nr:MAG: hypothetical protein Greene041662_367 [Candidatus Peregrinibacteria bacterium Greene0416_62]TSC99128.1 MAG: hypothetical protein Greene101449_704 [Candidatus Peregrinibacteria bacterium Greene1014_49]